MSAPIFNKPDDSYIFTGSQFRAGSGVDILRLSKGSSSVIDISQTAIDICASNVFINSANLRFGSLTLAAGTNLTVPGTLTSQTLSAGFITASGLAIFNNGLTVASGDLSAVTGTFSGNVNVTGQTTNVKDFVCQNLTATYGLNNISFSNGLTVTNGTTSVRALTATSGTFSSVLTSQNLSAGFITASDPAIFNNGLTITNGTLTAQGGTFSSKLTSQNLSAGFITASEEAIFNNGLTVNSAITSLRDLTTTSTVTFGGTLTVNGQTTSVRDFVSSGVATIPTLINVNSITFVQGANVTVPGTLTSQNIAAGVITASSLATFNNGLTITNGTLTAQGGTFSNGLTVTNGTLTAIGGTFSNGLSVTGGDLSVSNNLTLGGNLTVNGKTTIINSTNVDISDRSITLAAGNTLGKQGANGGGFDICGTGAAFNYYYNNSSSEEKFLSTVGISVSGNILPNNSTSVLPVSYNSFSVNSNQNRNFSNYLGSSTSEIPLSDYTTDISLLSAKSYVKVDIRVTYIASKEANQTLQFKVKRGLYNPSNALTLTNVCLEKVGSDMGVGLIDIYTASVIDRPLVNGRTSLNNRVTYSLHMTRNVLLDDSISDPIGIGVAEALMATGSNDVVSNYVLLQELYVPP